MGNLRRFFAFGGCATLIHPTGYRLRLQPQFWFASGHSWFDTSPRTVYGAKAFCVLPAHPKPASISFVRNGRACVLLESNVWEGAS